MDNALNMAVLLGILSITLFIYIVFMEIKHRRQIKQYKDILKKQVDGLGEVYSKLIEWRQELRTAKEILDVDRKKINPQLRDVFDKAFYDKYLFTNDPKLLFAEVDKKLSGYYSVLKEDYPDLSTKEYILCILYLLQIPNNDICLILNYSVNSLPTIKNRLCAKLNIGHATNLLNFLEHYL